MAIILPNAKQQFIDIDGNPLVSGTVGMYVPNTLTPKTTWQNSGETVLNVNPIILDSRGQALIYGNGTYRQILKDHAGNLIWDKPVSVGGGGGGTPYIVPELLTSIADNSTIMQAALDEAETLGVPVLLVGNGPYLFTAGFSFDVAKTSINGNGTQLDFSAMTSGVAITLTTSAPNANTMGGRDISHPVQNIFCYGPSSSFPVDLFNFTPLMIGPTPWMTGVEISNIGACGFAKFSKVGSGTVFMRWTNCWYVDDGRGNGTFLSVFAGTNNGENYYLDHCFVANSNCFICDESGGGNNVDIYCTSCSVDGVFYVLTGGTPPGSGQSAMTVFYNGHIEAIQVQSDFAFNISNGGFIFEGGEWVGSFGRTHTLANCSAAGSAPGMKLNNVVFNENSNNFVPYDTLWCEGAGNFSVTGASMLGNTQIGLFANGNNLIALPGAPDASLFTVSGTVARDLTHIPPVSGATASLKMTGTASAYVQVPVHPGQQASVFAWVETSGLVADGSTWAVVLQFLSSNGTLIQTITVSGSAELATWVKEINAPPTTPAPSGSALCRATFQVTGSGAGTSLVWFGYPQFNVY